MVSRVYHLTANTTIPANPPLAPGTRIEFVFIQDATGGRTITWDATFNDAPQPDQAANAVSLIEFFSVNGTNWRYDGPLFSVPWTTIWQGRGSQPTSAAAATYILQPFGAANVASGSAQGTLPGIFPLDAANYAMPTKIVQCRLVQMVIGQATAATTPTFNMGLYPITLSGLTDTLGTVVSGSQTGALTGPAANATVQNYGAAFTMPTAGAYAIGVATVGTGPATNPPHVVGLLQTRVL